MFSGVQRGDYILVGVLMYSNSILISYINYRGQDDFTIIYICGWNISSCDKVVLTPDRIIDVCLISPLFRVEISKVCCLLRGVGRVYCTLYEEALIGFSRSA